ncbi:MAG: thymidine phosphorylase [Clostridiales bacterium]|jgi:pyrimidine-nucleoside phosphorylase|nr:thymidine phosphorylase [Clostridiales bacterium]
MRAVDLIDKKRRSESLSAVEIQWLIKGYLKGDIPDYQMSAFLMAVCLNGMDARETAELTMSMMREGDSIDLSEIPGVKVDKHSTGGVGDTTTLVVAPLVAACGGAVAKMSGRGLGHTGGTLDKLESIPGLSVELGIRRFIEQVKNIGIAVIGQSGNLAPADKKIYALRDVTATVSSVPLIASSIMSKKLAAGADAIVLDVKTGSGAFLETVEESRRLAKTMVEIGNHLGRKVVALLTDMNQPLGLAVGNALEMREAIEVLAGKIKGGNPLYEVCMLLGVHMLKLGGIAGDDGAARKLLEEAVKSGAGIGRLKAMVKAQDGDESYIDVDKINELCAVKARIPVCAGQKGHISSMRTARIGQAAQMLGAGRATKDDGIDPAVGLVMHKRLHDAVEANEPICTFYVNDETRVQGAKTVFLSGVTIEAAACRQNSPMVYGVVE